jgi:hypothetical protein
VSDGHGVAWVQGAAAPERRAAPGPVPGRGLPGPVGGTNPSVDLQDWELTITSETGEQRRWDWNGFRALPSETVTVDLHCVTHWSKLGTTWEGVSLDTLLEGLETSASFALVSSYGGYSTNLPLEDLTDHKAWIASPTTARSWSPSTAARPGCWSPTCICGRAPSGCGGSSWGTRTSPASGRASAPQLRRPLAGATVLGRLNGDGHDHLEPVDRRQRARRPPP